MKKSLLLICILGSLLSFGQGKIPTLLQPNYLPSTFCIAGQMVNLTNAYTGQTAGSLLDSMAAASTINFTIASGTPGAYNPFAIFGTGGMSTLHVGVKILKISGTLSAIGYLQQSIDGVRWVNIRPASSADTFTIGNASATYSFDLSIKYTPYIRAVVTTAAGTMSASVAVDYFAQFPNYNASK